MESSISLVNEDDVFTKIDEASRGAAIGATIGGAIGGTGGAVLGAVFGVAMSTGGPNVRTNPDAPPQMRFTTDHSGDEHSLIDNYRSAMKHADGRQTTGLSIAGSDEKGKAALSRFAERYAPTDSAEAMRIYGS